MDFEVAGISNQIAIIDIDAFITELCVNLPNGLRQLADAIEAKRLNGRYQHHLAHGFGAGDRFGLHIKLYLDGKIATYEDAPQMLEAGK